jgi:predicted porin
MHASWDYVDADGADSETATGVFRASRLGFKGSEGLGGGLKAIWQVETQVNTGGSDLSLRNTFVGLSGGWGTVVAGRHDTPYKIATGKLDMFADRAADYNTIIGQTNDGIIFDERVPQTVAYITPNFNGFSAAIAYVEHYFDNNEDDRAWSVMGMYNQGGLFASLAYEDQKGPALTSVTGGALPGGDSRNAWKAGLGYQWNNFNIGGVYEDIDSDNKDQKRSAWYINGGYKFGNSKIGLAYGSADKSDGKNAAGNSLKDGADHWTIDFDYNFSKRTTLYALYTKIDNDKDATYQLNNGNGLNDGYGGELPGQDADVFSVGVIHKF